MSDLIHFLLTLTDSELSRDTAQLTRLRMIEKSHLYRNRGV